LETLSEEAIISLTVTLAHWALLGYLIIKRGFRHPLANLLSGYLGLTAAWNLLVFAQASGLNFAWPLAFIYLVILSTLVSCGFTHAFLEIRARKLWFALGGGGALALVGAVEVISARLLVPSRPVHNPLLADPRSAFWLGVITIAAFLGLAIRLAFKAQSETYSPRHRNRIQILLVSLALISFGLGLYLSPYPLAQGIGLIIQWLGAPILIYIVLNQNLIDINTGFKEVVNFLVLTFMTLIVYGSTVYVLQTILQDTPNATLIIAVIAAVLLATFYLPLRQLTQNLVEHLLFRHRYNDERVIKDYIRAINNILFMKDLVSISLNFIRKNLNITRSAFLLLSNQDEQYYYFSLLSTLEGELPQRVSLKKNTPLTEQLIDQGLSISQYTFDVAPEFRQADHDGVKALKAMAFEQYVPIKRNHLLIGIIALGPFVSGAPYTMRDIELFATLAAQTAMALENARLFENVRQNLEEITRIKNLMDNVFASIKSGVITASTSDELLLLNDAAYHIFNLPQTIAPGSHINQLMKYLENTALPALFRDVKMTQRSYHGHEVSFEFNGRGVVSLSVDLTPIKDAQKRLKGVALVINDMTEKNRLKAVQDMFRTYLSPAVVDRLPDDPAQLRLGGQRQEVTILFADIRGFTTFSEGQRPEDLITILNKYLSLAAESILAYEGTLDKFMGDAVMAIFNAPLLQEDHPLRAVRAAAEMQQKLHQFHRLIGDHAPQLQFGVGIHVGEAIVGNVGTQARMDYTAVGDAVNLAKRIQENTPGDKILLSQKMYERVQGEVNAIPYKILTLKGKQHPEQTYELLKVF